MSLGKLKLPLSRLRRTTLMAPFCALLVGSGLQAQAATIDGYPERPVTIVVSFSPGGGVDGVARILGTALSKSFKHGVVIENKPGGGGVIGAQAVVRAPADGYTFLLADPAFAVTPSLMAKAPYDIDKDFRAVSTVTTSPLVLSVPVASPFKTVVELQEAGRKGGKDYTYSSAGIGTSPHMSGELFRLRGKGHFVHVPYRGSGPAMADLVAGNIDFSFSTMAASLPFIRDGRLRALATTGLEPVAELKDAVPLAASLPGFDVRFWTTLMARSSTPPELVKKVNDAVRVALESDEVRRALRNIGETATYMSPEKSGDFVLGEYKRWGEVVKDAKISLN